MSPFLVPLGVFVMVVLIVALSVAAKIRNLEVDVHEKLHREEMEHQRKMQELELELKRIEQGTELAL
jgi:hypothetical protein